MFVLNSSQLLLRAFHIFQRATEAFAIASVATARLATIAGQVRSDTTAAAAGAPFCRKATTSG